MQYEYIAKQEDWDRNQEFEKKFEEFYKKHKNDFESEEEAKNDFLDSGLW